MGALAGQRAWVTGAGSGIGRATAVLLAGEGARVALTGRRRAPLEETAALIGASALVVPADLIDPDEVEAARDAVLAEFGGLDLVVSNAGANAPNRSWSAIDAATATMILEANLKAPFLVARAVLPALRASRGMIVHVASWAGRFVGALPGPAYTAAKHGLVALSHSLNLEACRDGVRSCVVEPGEVDTPILDRRPIPLPADVRARMLKPEDVAHAILFVATRPAHVCINEILLSPTANRGYLAEAEAVAQG